MCELSRGRAVHITREHELEALYVDGRDTATDELQSGRACFGISDWLEAAATASVTDLRFEPRATQTVPVRL
jgi:hypothetical protein